MNAFELASLFGIYYIFAELLNNNQGTSHRQSAALSEDMLAQVQGLVQTTTYSPRVEQMSEVMETGKIDKRMQLYERAEFLGMTESELDSANQELPSSDTVVLAAPIRAEKIKHELTVLFDLVVQYAGMFDSSDTDQLTLVQSQFAGVLNAILPTLDFTTPGHVNKPLYNIISSAEPPIGIKKDFPFSEKYQNPHTRTTWVVDFPRRHEGKDKNYKWVANPANEYSYIVTESWENVYGKGNTEQKKIDIVTTVNSFSDAIGVAQAKIQDLMQSKTGQSIAIDRRQQIQVSKTDKVGDAGVGEDFAVDWWQKGTTENMTSETAYAQQLYPMFEKDYVNFQDWALSSDEPQQGNIQKAAKSLYNDMHGSNRAVAGTSYAFSAKDANPQYDDDSVNVVDALRAQFEQKTDEEEFVYTGSRDTVRGNLYDMQPSGKLGQANTLTFLNSDFSIKGPKVETLQEGHLEHGADMVGIGPVSLRPMQQGLAESTFQNLWHNDDQPQFWDAGSGAYTDSRQPTRDAGILTGDDRFLRDPSFTHSNVDSTGHVKPILEVDNGRGDRLLTTTYQPGCSIVANTPERSSYVENSMRMVPHDASINGPPQSGMVHNKPKMNEHISNYEGQVTGTLEYVPYVHTPVVLDDPKKLNSFDAHTWKTDPVGNHTAHVNAPDAVRASLRNEYVEYSYDGNQGCINAQHGRSLQTQAAGSSVQRDQNLRSSYTTNERDPIANAMEYTPQIAHRLTNTETQLPTRNTPDIEQDVDAGLLEALSYNPLVP